MTEELRRQAEELAHISNYSVQIEADQTTENETPIFLASIRELPGCMAQGATVDEAMKNLAEVKIEFIESLLEDNLPVPTGTTTQTASLAERDIREETVGGSPSFMDDHARASRPSYRRVVGEVSEVPI